MIEPKLLKLIDSFFQLFFFLSLAFMAGVIIYLGIIYITSSGDKLKNVHKKLPLLLIGAVLIFSFFNYT
jgi:formate/nitrite transporter FocA (FNT family)